MFESQWNELRRNSLRAISPPSPQVVDAVQAVTDLGLHVAAVAAGREARRGAIRAAALLLLAADRSTATS